ncbi:MAG: monovalent cation/H+ antiporter complex subunit F [Candidatus Omnitrophica bacterium]|nr:monovalent cation/H+ antiporter complex subunit F [Candidatus Omnitrophota bacterium]MCM8809359.1 monovalent cation/H+ antiporter complex subunit F [Candidatus Omnitrophota bacterium]MCM8832636.1 monovalent cation/H+ antiporter complex subunit F [Candidatus Omnitrophota bacterium]
MNAIFIFIGICVAMCIYRIARGPTAADRMVGIDILGLVIIVYSVFYSLFTGIDFYMNIAIAWSIIGFVSTITLAKFLEGRKFDD